MFNSPWRAIIWSGVFVMMLLSLLSPFSIITVSFMALPVLVLYMILERRSFVIHIGIALGIVLIMTGAAGIAMLLIGLFFVMPAAVIGEMYKRHYPSQYAVLAGILTMIVQLLLGIAIASLFGFHLAAEMDGLMRETYQILHEIMPQQVSQEMIDQQIQLMIQLIPSYIMVIALYYTLITHWIGRKLLRRAGYDITALPSVRHWTLPKSVVWVYIALLVLSLFTTQDDASMFTMVFYNLLPILTIAFCVQGVAFLFFVAHHKGWNRVLPVAGIIACLFASTLMSLVGVFDIVFEMRKRIQGNQS